MSYKKYFSSDGFDFVLYQHLSEQDLLKVLSFRNDINVRKWMFNSDKIKLEEHLVFTNKLKNNSDKVYCAVFRKTKIIACVYFDDIGNNEYYVGHFLNPKLLYSGMGLFFEFVYLKFFFNHMNAKKIRATVKKDNLPMIKIHRLCNFKETFNENLECFDYEFSIIEYKALPENIQDFLKFLTNKYLNK